MRSPFTSQKLSELTATVQPRLGIRTAYKLYIMAEALWQNKVEKPVPVQTLIPQVTAVRVKSILHHILLFELTGKIIWYLPMLQQRCLATESVISEYRCGYEHPYWTHRSVAVKREKKEVVSILICAKNLCYCSAYSKLAPLHNGNYYSANTLYHTYTCAACLDSGSSVGKFGSFLVYE